MQIKSFNINSDNPYHCNESRWREFISHCEHDDIPSKALSTSDQQQLRTLFPEFAYFCHPLFLPNLQTLILDWLPLTTVSMFASIPNLVFNSIPDLRILTNIGRKLTLVVKWCEDLTDIQISEPIESLQISECEKLIKIEGLHHVNAY